MHYTTLLVVFATMLANGPLSAINIFGCGRLQFIGRTASKALFLGTNTVTYEEAQSECKTTFDKGHLLRVLTTEDRNGIANGISSLPYTRIWVGLTAMNTNACPSSQLFNANSWTWEDMEAPACVYGARWSQEAISLKQQLHNSRGYFYKNTAELNFDPNYVIHPFVCEVPTAGGDPPCLGS